MRKSRQITTSSLTAETEAQEKLDGKILQKIYQITLVSVKYNKSRWHFFHNSKPFKLKWVSAKSNKSGLHFYHVLFDLGNSVKLQQVFTI